MVDSVSLDGAQAPTQTAPTQQNAQILDPDEFLKLFLMELNNQDPMNPVDNKAFMSQLSQYVMVSNTAQLVESNAAIAQQNEKANALSLLYKNVKVKDVDDYLLVKSINFDDTGKITLQLASTTDMDAELKVVTLDEIIEVARYKDGTNLEQLAP